MIQKNVETLKTSPKESKQGEKNDVLSKKGKQSSIFTISLGHDTLKILNSFTEEIEIGAFKHSNTTHQDT